MKAVLFSQVGSTLKRSAAGEQLSERGRRCSVCRLRRR